MSGSVLQHVDLIRPDGKPLSGLVPVRLPNGGKSTLPVDEQAAVFDAAVFTHIDYIFFRRFSDGRSSQIAAYVVDNSDERLDEAELAQLHWQLWLHGIAALLYVAWPTRIDVLTCVREPDFWQNEQIQYRPAEWLLVETIQTASAIDAELEKRARLSAFRLADGTFWEDPHNARLANHDKAAHQALIQAVVETDRALDGENSPVLRRLLLLMIVIKYLEDRRVFPSGWFGKFHKGARNFFEVLESGEVDKVERLLATLERRFNGDIFALPQNNKNKLTKKALRQFAQLVEGKTLNQQRYLWEQYSFEHLPVEVISNLYQRFVKGGRGAVYTPPFLAALLLDHAMPYEKLTGAERILDPACGSGVFLVGAFRRLINAWRSRHGWQRPDVATLKKILQNSIFGIELDPNAVDLTAVSLAVAVCDALKSEVIWKELRFDPFRGRNLFEADFFQLILDRKDGLPTVLDDGFDVVVGNPPFESKLTPQGQKLNKTLKRGVEGRGGLPDNQTAYFFLEQAFDVVRPKGKVCLIQPSGFLYNQKVRDFRSYIFRQNQINVIFDFTSIRNLYEAADAKTIAVSASRRSTLDNNHFIIHLTFRRTATAHEQIWFEIDHYDRHRVSEDQAKSKPFVWRVNLLGGGRLLNISQRLRLMQTLAAFIEKQGWANDYGEGFIAASGENEADFLTGKPYLPTDALTTRGIDESRIDQVRERYFESPRHEERYLPPLVLIKEHHELPIAFWDNGPLAYRDKIVGIHAPPSDTAKLRELYELFCQRHEIYRFCCTLNGTQSLVGKSTAILKQDIDNLPFPEDPNELEFSFWEEILMEDVLKYMTYYIRRGQNSELLKNAASGDDLTAYADVFCRMLGSIYENLQADQPVFLNGLIGQPFFFGEHPKISWAATEMEEHLRNLVYHQQHERLRTVRVVRFYTENVFLIVKPDRLRYWIRSTAIRDADETFIDLRQQGY